MGDQVHEEPFVAHLADEDETLQHTLFEHDLSVRPIVLLPVDARPFIPLLPAGNMEMPNTRRIFLARGSPDTRSAPLTGSRAAILPCSTAAGHMVFTRGSS